MPSLSGPLLKLARAREHLEMLQSEIDPFEERLTNDSVSKELDNSGNVVWRFRFNDAVSEQVLKRASLISGDVVHNLRSCLDHLVWELSNDSKRSRCFFPIFLEKSKFDSKKTEAIGSLDARAQEIIEGFQPYNAPLHPLWAIHDLDIRDKHRHLLAQVAGNRSVGYMAQSRLPKFVLPSRLRDGDVLASAPTNLTNLDDYIEPVFLFRVVSHEHPLLRDLGLVTSMARLCNFVANDVIPQFRNFFDVMQLSSGPPQHEPPATSPTLQ